MRRMVPLLLVAAWLLASGADRALGGDWPQWCGSQGKNMISDEKGLPDSFVPGDKLSRERRIDLATAKNVRWGVKVCDAFYSTPSVAGGRIFIGGLESGRGVFACLDEATGKLLWRWEAPPRAVPREIDGFQIGIGVIPQQIGVCATAAIEGDRVYFVSNRFDVLCLDARGQAPGAGAANDESNFGLDGLRRSEIPAPKLDLSPSRVVARPPDRATDPSAGHHRRPKDLRSAPSAGSKTRAELDAPSAESKTVAERQARVVWAYDTWKELGVFPCDAANGSPLIDGDLLYVPTSNGVDRNSFQNPYREKERRFPALNAPNVVVLDKNSGRLVAVDEAPIMKHLLHGQWSSLSLGKVGGRRLAFYGGGDGLCYAFEALASVPKEKEVIRLKTVWSCDCIPPEYKATGDMDWITYYCLGDRRVKGTLNKHDGTFMGESEIIATPVFLDNRVYVAIGRDPAHGRGRGALHCIDATLTGDITQTGKIWTYQGLDRTLSTVSVAGGLVYVSDVAGRLHCLDARTGKLHWIHDARCETWGSTLVADGKVYMPTSKGLWVLAAGKQLKVLSRINLGAKVDASPVAANDTLYVATSAGWLWAVR